MRRQILQAIASAVERGGDETAAFAALKGVDPLLRFLARRRLRLALTDVILEAPVQQSPAGGDSEDGAHLLRLVYLSVAGAPTPVGSAGPVAVVQAYEISRRSAGAPGRRLWWITGLLVLVALMAASCGGVMAYRALRGEPALRADPPPPPAGAFALGGVPPSGGAVLDRALGRDLPDFLVALDSWRRARGQGMPTGEPARRWEQLEAARDRLQARVVGKALGPRATHWLARLLDLSKTLATVRRVDPLTPSLVQAVVAFNDALAARGIGYYLDGDVLQAPGDVRIVLLYVFRVERVLVFAAGARRVRTLLLRRLDKLNWAHSALGFTRREHHEALVLLNSVDDILVTHLLPALGDRKMVLVDSATMRSSARWPEALARRAAAAVRAELARVPGVTLETAEQLAVLLARRRALVKRWQDKLNQHGYSMVEPTQLTFDWDYQRALSGVVPAPELQEMGSLDRALSAPQMARTLKGLRRVVAASVAHHETQHRLDYDWLASRPLPPVLERLVGPLTVRGLKNPLARRARDELSAYLAELARAEHTAQLDLALIARFVFDRYYRGSSESFAAQVILHGLAARLGLTSDPLRALGRAGARRHFARLYLRLSHQHPGVLRHAALRLWEDLYGIGLPDLRSIDPPGPRAR